MPAFVLCLPSLLSHGGLLMPRILQAEKQEEKPLGVRELKKLKKKQHVATAGTEGEAQELSCAATTHQCV
jgi:hypothetical protein